MNLLTLYRGPHEALENPVISRTFWMPDLQYHLPDNDVNLLTGDEVVDTGQLHSYDPLMSTEA